MELSEQECDRVDSDRKAGSSSGTFVVRSQSGRALYFSKSPIPSRIRDSEKKSRYLKHIGIYGYRVDTLRKLCEFSPTHLEGIEQLEQLRALENDIDIQVVQYDLQGRRLHSVDHPEDVLQVEAIIREQGELL